MKLILVLNLAAMAAASYCIALGLVTYVEPVNWRLACASQAEGLRRLGAVILGLNFLAAVLACSGRRLPDSSEPPAHDQTKLPSG